MANSRPNFLIFMTDMESGSLFREDYPLKLPNAQRLANQGVKFTRAFTPTAHCSPSRATFFTGLYPTRHGVLNGVHNSHAFRKGLKPGVVTLGEHLKEAGYKLSFTGKWHVSYEKSPADLGWECLTAFAVGKDGEAWSWDRWLEWAAQPPDPSPRGRGEIVRAGWWRERMYGTVPHQFDYQDDPWYKTVAPAIKALPELAAGEEPWCMYIGIPERKYTLPEKYARMYSAADVELPASFYDKMEDKPNIYRRLRQQVFDQLSEQEARELIAHSWGYWTMIDDMLGEVLDTLQRTGAADNTVVMFVSDHGSYAGAHGLFWIGIPAFTEQYHIPMIVRWPNGIAAPGRSVDAFVTLADAMPTFLELAGCNVPADLSGRSLCPFLRNETPADWRDCFCSQFHGNELYVIQRAVITDDYKFVYNGFDFDELYDLKADPYEMVNIAGRPEMQEIIREMSGRMWRFAYREQDFLRSGWVNVSMATYGPIVGLRGLVQEDVV